MDDLLARLPPSGCVLDLGSGAGSFPYQRYCCRIIALDTQLPLTGPESRPAPAPQHYVTGRGAALPFQDESVDVVVASHFFEHLADPAAVVREIARVLQPSGILFAAVPAGECFSDRLYRLWTLGGGHLQRFSFRRFQEMVEQDSDLELLFARRLYSSFSFLRPRPEVAIHLPRRSQLLKYLPGWARDLALGGLNGTTRLLDALLGTRLSLYGWACYFGRPAARLPAPAREEYLNVCSHCGAGHPYGQLQPVRPALYRCSRCGCLNPRFGPWLHRITAKPMDEEERFVGTGILACPGVQRPVGEQEGPSPHINPGGVVNAASYTAAISPGSLVAVFGINLAGPDTELLVNGQPVPLLHASAEQLTAYLPPDLPRGPACFQVRQGGRRSPPVSCPLFLTGPGLFSRDGTGQGIAALEGEPRPGQTVSLLATGLGPVAPDGQTLRRCQVWVAGRRVWPQYCGLWRGPAGSDQAPPGLYQVELRVPAGLPGDVAVQVVVGGRASNILCLRLRA